MVVHENMECRCYASLGRREGEHKYTGTITVQEAAVASSLLLPMPCVGNVCEGEQKDSGTITVHSLCTGRYDGNEARDLFCVLFERFLGMHLACHY